MATLINQAFDLFLLIAKAGILLLVGTIVVVWIGGAIYISIDGALERRRERLICSLSSAAKPPALRATAEPSKGSS